LHDDHWDYHPFVKALILIYPRGHYVFFYSRDLILKLLPTLRLGLVAAFENRQPVTAAKFINKSSLFILLLDFIRRLELKPITELRIYSSPRHIAKTPPMLAKGIALIHFIPL